MCLVYKYNRSAVTVMISCHASGYCVTSTFTFKKIKILLLETLYLMQGQQKQALHLLGRRQFVACSLTHFLPARVDNCLPQINRSILWSVSNGETCVWNEVSGTAFQWRGAANNDSSQKSVLSSSCDWVMNICVNRVVINNRDYKQYVSVVFVLNICNIKCDHQSECIIETYQVLDIFPSFSSL